MVVAKSSPQGYDSQLFPLIYEDVFFDTDRDSLSYLIPHKYTVIGSLPKYCEISFIIYECINKWIFYV